MANSMKLGAKIGAGYTLIGLVLVCAVGITIWQLRETSAVTHRVIDLRAPTAQASLMMTNGVNHSLAALRGWMILGKKGFVDERKDAWEKEIEPAMKAMEAFSKNWTNPKNLTRLTNIRDNLGKFKAAQQEIEDIAQTKKNQPALAMLLDEAAPKEGVMSTTITEMINLEAAEEATPERKALLGMMADVRGTLGLGLASIRAYLISGDKGFVDQFNKLWAKNTRRLGDLSKNAQLLTPAQKKAFDKFNVQYQVFNPLPPKMFALRGGKEWNLANHWLGTKAAPRARIILAALGAMAENQQKLMAADMVLAKEKTTFLKDVEWGLLVVGILICAGLGVTITRSITKPITRIIAGLTEGSAQVYSAGNQISSSSQSLAEGATEQAASLEETSSALEEMASMTRQNADNANNANASMTKSREQVETGAVAVKEMAGAMGEINESSEKISRIIKTIEEIAFQTNLLALNAAVEAARAGDAGKGFAVVADEVRNLAQRSAQAARDTAELIEGTVVRVKNGTEIVTKLEESFAGIEDSTGHVAGLVSEISAATNEQAQGLEQVNTAVAQMDKVTQNNAANAEESASASEELSAQAAQLNEMVDQLAMLVGGTASQNGNGHTLGNLPPVGMRSTPPANRLANQDPQSLTVVSPQQQIPFDTDDFKEF